MTAANLLLAQTQRAEDALEIVIAIIFNLDPAAFLAVMNQHPGAEMFLQSVLQIVDRRGGGDGRPAPSWAGAAELSRDEPLSRTNCCAPPQDRLGDGALFLRLFQREKGLRVTTWPCYLRRPEIKGDADHYPH